MCVCVRVCVCACVRTYALACVCVCACRCVWVFVSGWLTFSYFYYCSVIVCRGDAGIIVCSRHYMDENSNKANLIAE